MQDYIIKDENAAGLTEVHFDFLISSASTKVAYCKRYLLKIMYENSLRTSAEHTSLQEKIQRKMPLYSRQDSMIVPSIINGSFRQVFLHELGG